MALALMAKVRRKVYSHLVNSSQPVATSWRTLQRAAPACGATTSMWRRPPASRRRSTNLPFGRHDAGVEAGGLRHVTLLIAILALAGCSHEVRRAQAPAARHSRTAVSAVMTRHIEKAVDAGDGDLELRGLRQRVASDAADLDARILLARLYSRRGYPDLALEHYRIAASRFPDALVTVLSLAKALRESDEPEEALRVTEQYSGSHNEANWELLSLQGVLYDERGDLTRAEAAYRAALALDANRAAVHNNLGYNLVLQRKPEAAAAEFRKAVEIDPRSQIARNNLAEALAGQEKPADREALAEWQRADGAPAAHNNLGAVLIEQGRYAEARPEIEAALAAQPNFPEAMANLRLLSQQDGLPVELRLPPGGKPRHVGSQPGFWKRVATFNGIFEVAHESPKQNSSKHGPGKTAPERAAGPARVQTAEGKGNERQ